MLLRYAMLVGAAAAAIWSAVNLGADNSKMLLVDAGAGLSNPNASLWILGLIATFITLSLCKFVIFGLPSMADGWYRDNKSWLVVSGAGAAIYAMLYLI